MKSSNGFTVIELLVVVVVLMASSVLFFVQKAQVESASRDEIRKTSINSMYYTLEEVYFKNNSSYPRTLDSETLPSVDPQLFTDPNGIKIGEINSEFRYEPLNCEVNACKSYVLRTTLENEDDYIKESAN